MTVAVATTWRVAERTPASTEGMAQGTSMRVMIWASVQPMPRAATAPSGPDASTCPPPATATASPAR